MNEEFGLDRYDVATLSRRTGVKWSRHGDNALAAWVADMDFPIAPPIADAIGALVATDDLGYPGPELDRAVRETFANRYHDRYDLSFDAADVVVVTDVLQAIYLALLTLTDPGDGVVVLTPAYPPFFAAIESTGRRAHHCELLKRGDGYEVDLDALGESVRAGARCVLLCNPHNPTGHVLSHGELMGIAELAVAADLVVIADEVHADLVLDGREHHPIAAIGPTIAARTVTLSSASKAFNLAGLRCAVAAFGSRALRARFDSMPTPARGVVSVLGMVATVAAWRDGGAWLDAVLRQLDTNRSAVVAWADATTGVRLRPPAGTYLAWLDFADSVAGADPEAFLLEHARVALARGADFGPSGRSFARLNFATPAPVLEAALAAIGAAIGRR